MAEKIDPRIVRISIEINGEFQVFEGLAMRARGQKTANPLQNTCEVDIVNLTKEKRNYLLTETSPFNTNKTPKRLIVEAGRKSTGVTRLFYGEITSASPSQPPDIGLNLKAQTGTFAKGKVIARSGSASQSLKSIASNAAQDIGVGLDFQAQDKNIANYSFNGSAYRQVDALGAAGGVDVFVDDETLVIKDKGVPLKDRVKLLSKNTGMIGIPEVTEQGIKVRFLLDTNTVVGGALDVRSELNPALDGLYSIFALDFEVSTRDKDFYFIADARRTKT